MTTVCKLAVLGLSVTLAAAFSGCDKSRDEMRPDMDKVVSGEHGLQSGDIRQIAALLAPDLLKIPEIAQSPYRVTVVVTGVENKTEDMPGRNLDIYAARLADNLNTVTGRTQIAFVENQGKLNAIRQQELGGPAGPVTEDNRYGAPPTDPRVKPQYALYGTIYSQDNGKTTYYLCDFKLTNLATGVQTWSNHYEVRTGN